MNFRPEVNDLFLTIMLTVLIAIELSIVLIDEVD